MNTLQIIKIKLGLMPENTYKDSYFNALIESTIVEFKNMGIVKYENDLVADYVLFKHRGDVEMSKNLRLRINNARIHNVSIR